MKTLFIFLFCGCMLSANQMFAQKPGNLLPVVTITAENNVSEALRSAFSLKFKDAENMRWFEANKNYLVKFIMNDQEHQAMFKRDGQMVYHISYGDEKNLPETVKQQVDARYGDYNISRVFNVERQDGNIWIVNLENKKHIVITSIDGDNMYQIARYKNATAGYPAISEGY